jgi:hypothetical protein
MSEKIESWEGIDDRIRVKGGRGKYRLIETFDYVSCFSMASCFRPCTIRSSLSPSHPTHDKEMILFSLLFPLFVFVLCCSFFFVSRL